MALSDRSLIWRDQGSTKSIAATAGTSAREMSKLENCRFEDSRDAGPHIDNFLMRMDSTVMNLPCALRLARSPVQRGAGVQKDSSGFGLIRRKRLVELKAENDK